MKKQKTKTNSTQFRTIEGPKLYTDDVVVNAPSIADQKKPLAYLQDSDGNKSSKRFIVMLLTGVLVISIIVVLSLSSFKIELSNALLIKDIVWGLIFAIVSLAVGGTAAEGIKHLRGK